MPRDTYHALLARHDAMRLRRNLLSPQSVEDDRGPVAAPYNGIADQQLIMRCLGLVTPFDDLILHLYEVLFERHPYLRSLFPESMEFQRTHLERIFRFLIENLHRPDEVSAVFTQLGRDHRKLGVRPAQYEAFEEALIEALRRRAGRGWTDALGQAWLRALRFAVGAMTEGADSALTEPVAWQATVTEHQLRAPGLAVLRVQTHEPFPYRAGQYAALESPLLPRAWRPYHLARAPRPDGVLEFHVRLAGAGGVSDALVRHTRPGDVLRIGAAHGTMTLDDRPAGDLLLVASGTGWAPMKALLQEVEAWQGEEAEREVHLFLEATALPELYDVAYLHELERRCPWLRVVPVIGEGRGTDGYSPVAEAVSRHGDWSGHLAFVSGPPEMARATVAGLVGAGVPVERIRHDSFSRATAARTAPAGRTASTGMLREGA
ncbi:FAD-binding oxidoreductase [Streptomyces sannanensis]|uniref:nitric oxide dioxygenase n=1 Tax=Streptomyces sannanensis TaxID=285536 RepID=A0ABP6SDP3_9ACTN